MVEQVDKAAPESAIFALVELGSLHIGVATEHVMQAIPWPDKLAALPRGNKALLGVFSHSGQIVPLVQLQKWIDPAINIPPGTQEVLILRAEGKVLGLAVDSVRGLLHADPADVHQVHHDSTPDEFFRSVVLAEDKTSLLSLLDVPRLMLQVQTWAASTPLEASDATADTFGGGASTAPPNSVTNFAVVGTDQTLLGFDAAHVGEILPMPKIQTALASDSLFLGMARWRGRDVPVMNIKRAIGMPIQSAASAPWLLVLSAQGRCIGVPVDTVQLVRAIPGADIQPVEVIAPAFRNLYLGTVNREDKQRLFLLDTPALVASFSLSALSLKPDGATADAASQRESDAAASTAHVVFRAGRTWAAPLDAALQEICRLPATFQPVPRDSDHTVGQFEWRSQAIPLLDLRWANHQVRTQFDAETRVIVVHVHGRTVGLVVEELMALVPAHVGTHTRFSMGGHAALHMITVGWLSAQKSYGVMHIPSLTYFTQQQRVTEVPS